MNRTMKNKKGFTLMEMHKAKVAADWANLRAYYAELQLDYLTRGAYNRNVPLTHADTSAGQMQQNDISTIPFLNGDEVKLQAGTYWALWSADDGYQIAYNCDNSADEHSAPAPAPGFLAVL